MSNQSNHQTKKDSNSCCQREEPCCRLSENMAEEATAPVSQEEQPEAMVTVPQSEMDQLRKDLAEYQDRYLRTLAEMDNMRKRLQRAGQDNARSVREDIAKDFLSPLDQFELALHHAGNMSDEVKNWAIGFNMILNQLKENLSRMDIHPFESEGKQFDPYLHEAVEIVETNDYPSGTIVKQYYRGYKAGDRVIRPAQVKVAKAKTEAEKANNEQQTNENTSAS